MHKDSLYTAVCTHRYCRSRPTVSFWPDTVCLAIYLTWNRQHTKCNANDEMWRKQSFQLKGNSTGPVCTLVLLKCHHRGNISQNHWNKIYHKINKQDIPYGFHDHHQKAIKVYLSYTEVQVCGHTMVIGLGLLVKIHRNVFDSACKRS